MRPHRAVTSGASDLNTQTGLLARGAWIFQRGRKQLIAERCAISPLRYLTTLRKLRRLGGTDPNDGVDAGGEIETDGDVAPAVSRRAVTAETGGSMPAQSTWELWWTKWQ